MCGHNISEKVNSIEEFIGKTIASIIEREKRGKVNIGPAVFRSYKFPCGEIYEISIKRVE